MTQIKSQPSPLSPPSKSRRFSDYFHLKNLRIPHKLGLIVFIFSIIICSLLFLSNFGMGMISDLRAYVGGKGLWAIAQKEAVYHLARYVIFQEEEDYQRYSDHLKVPLGDRKALIELKKKNTDLEKVDAGFIEGGNHRIEVRRMGHLFKRFHAAPYIRDAIEVWIKADSLFDEMIRVGEDVRREVTSGNMSEAKKAELLARIEDVNNQLTPLEDLFDYRLGESARWLWKLLVFMMLGVTVFLLFWGVLIAVLIARHLMNEMDQLQKAATKIAEGDFSQPIDVTSLDEIGDLARHFQQMALQREQAEKMLDERARELGAANQKLVETERIKDEFFATVSHELRTPLTLVLTPLESLLIETHGALSAGQRGILEIMHNNAIRLLQMVTGLLDFSKFGAGRMEIRREPTDIVAVTRSIMDDFSAMLTHKKIENHLAAGPLGMVMMDRYFYERILFNLLSNAVKFTPAGGRIFVSLKSQAGRLYLAVSDTGIGISEENQKHLFEKFKQIEGASTRRFEGTGLGLALVKEFAALLGGSVSVESRPGKGSTFTVDCEAPAAEAETLKTLERPRQKLVQQYRMDSGLPRAAGPADKNGLPKLLIAEDNLELASYLSTQIQDIVQLQVARNGEEALEIVRTWSPDLVLSDVMMPERDGLSLCRAIKADAVTAHIPVILLTALTHREALLKGWEAGADEYLFKPFHPTELITRVKSVLSNSKERRKTQLILEESQQQLELNVQERTTELLEANKNLLKQKQDLEKVNLELDSFVYTASHDLRTPLRSIASFATLLEENYRETLDEAGRDYLNRVVKSAERMDMLIQDLLTLSRLSRIQHPYEEVDTGELLDSVRERLEFDLRETKVDLQIQTGLPKIYCDRVKMAEVWVNLLNNAIKFSVKPDGSRHPWVRVNYSDQGEFHEFCVKDNGIGIDSKYHERIFRLFERLNPHSQYGGTGVGLNIVKRVIEDHGGRVWVAANLGEGAAFYFTLPKNPKNKGA